jgi:tetratricopeptide (TPR) repeat protein
MPASTDPFESHLKRAADLFESGDIVQAGQIWQAILKKNPDHQVARAGLYKVKLYFDARATQGGLAKSQPPRPEPVSDLTTPGTQPAVAVAHPTTISADLARLLDQGCTLYDNGHIEDALGKWNKVLEMDPNNILAKGYINGAKRRLEQPVSESQPEEQVRSTMALAPGAYPGSVPFPVEPAPSMALAPIPPVPYESKPESAPEPVETVDVERLLRDGCTLYDMG